MAFGQDSAPIDTCAKPKPTGIIEDSDTDRFDEGN